VRPGMSEGAAFESTGAGHENPDHLQLTWHVAQFGVMCHCPGQIYWSAFSSLRNYYGDI
jgi:hypothetical protein